MVPACGLFSGPLVRDRAATRCKHGASEWHNCGLRAASFRAVVRHGRLAASGVVGQIEVTRDLVRQSRAYLPFAGGANSTPKLVTVTSLGRMPVSV